MKISLLTIWRVRNYGAEMQAYATIKILQKLGHDVCMINFRLTDLDKSFKYSIEKIVSPFFLGNRKFIKFWKKYIPTTIRYKSLESIYKNPPKSDVYLVGSDQVWNAEITMQAAPLFFLNFGNSNIKKVSYASSFGTLDWNNDNITRGLVESFLPKFSSVSCRELSGVNILDKSFAIKSTCVLDPTLLFTAYPELTGDIKQKNTLAFYPLGVFPELEQFSLTLAQIMSIEHKVVNKKTYLFNKLVWDRTSIESWISNIAESRFVVTQSFHGLAFSLIYNRQFLIVIQDKMRATRVISLLKQLNLEDRCFFSVEDAMQSRIWEIPIDYAIINEKLSIFRNISINYLKESLR